MKQKISAFLMASALLLTAGLASCGETTTSSSEAASSTIDATKGYIQITKGSNVASYTAKVFDLVSGKPGEMTDLAADNYVTPDASRWVALSITCADGYEVDKVTSNNIDMTQISGFYCVNVKTAGTYKIKITAKAKEEEATTYAEVVNETTEADAANIESVAYSMALDSHYSDIKELVDGNKIPVAEGNWLYIAVTTKAGYEVDKVTVNGTECGVQFSYYVFQAVPAKITDGKIHVVVTTKVASSEDTPVEYAIFAEATKDEHVTSVTYKYCANNNFGGISDLEEGNQFPVTTGNWFCVKVECGDGYEVDTVKVNDDTTQFNSGFYCISITKAGSYTVTVTSKASA